MKVVETRPPNYENVDSRNPAIFLAGPIQGAPDWQKLAVHELARTSPFDIFIFNPRVSGISSHSYEQQVKWEKSHLERARDNGAILFWFAAQDFSIPYPQKRAYAQTSRIEFGRAIGWRDYNARVKVLLGIDLLYKGGNERYLRSCADEHSILIHSSLGALCLDAIKQLEKL